MYIIIRAFNCFLDGTHECFAFMIRQLTDRFDFYLFQQKKLRFTNNKDKILKWQNLPTRNKKVCKILFHDSSIS